MSSTHTKESINKTPMKIVKHQQESKKFLINVNYERAKKQRILCLPNIKPKVKSPIYIRKSDPHTRYEKDFKSIGYYRKPTTDLNSKDYEDDLNKALKFIHTKPPVPRFVTKKSNKRLSDNLGTLYKKVGIKFENVKNQYESNSKVKILYRTSRFSNKSDNAFINS